MTITVGATLPDAVFKTMTDSGLADVPSADIFGSGKVAVFAVPGAFTPTCHARHMPGFVGAMDALRAKGIDKVVCISVNDPFVMDAWGDATTAKAAGITMLCDPTAAFTTAIGLQFDGAGAGLGVRSRRYSMLVEDGVVKVLNVEDAPGQVTCTASEVLIEQI